MCARRCGAPGCRPNDQRDQSAKSPKRLFLQPAFDKSSRMRSRPAGHPCATTFKPMGPSAISSTLFRSMAGRANHAQGMDAAGQSAGSSKAAGRHSCAHHVRASTTVALARMKAPWMRVYVGRPRPSLVQSPAMPRTATAAAMSGNSVATVRSGNGCADEPNFECT